MLKEHTQRWPEGYGFMQEKEIRTAGIIAKDFSLSIGTKKLIEPSNFAVGSGEKIALVGRNGAGKTTLFKTIYALYKKLPLPHEITVGGSLETSPETRIGYLPQDVQIDYNGTVNEYLDSCAQETTQVLKQFERLSHLVETDHSEVVLSDLGKAMEQIDMLDGWNYQKRKQEIIEGLGLSGSYFKRDIRDISGGEATKVALAGVLLSNPNIVLLDEPTNNLDIRSLLFLEQWISEQQSMGFIIVAHDRVFLDNAVNTVLEIDEESLKIMTFGDNYSFYSQKKQKIFEARLRKYEETVRKKKRLERETQRLKSAAQSFETTSPEAFFRRKGAKLQKKAVQLRERAEKMIAEMPEPEPPKIPAIEVGEAKPGKARILSFKNLLFHYPETPKELFGGFSFSLHQGERVVIIGPNGSGKSTFLKILVGELRHEDLELELNREMKIGYIPQNLILENPQENLLDYCRKFISGFPEDISKLLGKVIFTDPSQLRIGNLSLGELKRVLLSIIFAQVPDLLILDEPINHLDLYTAEMLDKALERYKGTVLVVSHDRYFLQRLKAKRLLIIKNGTVVEREIEGPKEIIDAFGEI